MCGLNVTQLHFRFWGKGRIRIGNDIKYNACVYLFSSGLKVVYNSSIDEKYYTVLFYFKNIIFVI